MENLKYHPAPTTPLKYYSKEGYFISSIGGTDFDVKNRETGEWLTYKFSDMGINPKDLNNTNDWELIETAFAKFLGESEEYGLWKSKEKTLNTDH
jgi:hypothetical protein